MKSAVPTLLVLGTLLVAGCLETPSPTTPTSPTPTLGVKTSCGSSPQGGYSSGELGSPLPSPLGFQALREETPTQQGPSELVVGTLLPLTGVLAAFGPDMQSATDLAVEEINDAGGVNGAPVRILHEDDKSVDVAQAPQTFNSLVSRGAQAVVGGAASSITGAILDSAKSSKVMVVTPASTSPALTRDRDNGGYFLRVPPSDALQGKVLARVVYEAGCRSATILEVNNAYGVGLGSVFEETFTSLGGTVRSVVKFLEEAPSYTTEVQKAGADRSDAIVFIGYPGQGVPILKEAYQRGITAQSVFFFSEGVKDETQFVQAVGKDSQGRFLLSGLEGTAPGSVTSPGFAHFNESFRRKYGHAPGLFAAESYDAVWMIALAAQCAGKNTGEGIKEMILKVANQDGATDIPVSGANPEAALTAARAPGCLVNYQGAAHDFNFDSKGDPTEGIYTVWKITDDGKIQTVRENIRP